MVLITEPKPDELKNQSETVNSSQPANTKENTTKWGYDLYPERKGEPIKRSWGRVLLGMEGTENIDKLKCERNVYSCVKNSPMVKLMMGALKSSGW